jgi:hypothetical protein
MKLSTHTAAYLLTVTTAFAVAVAESSVGSDSYVYGVPEKICGNTCRFTFCPPTPDYLFPISDTCADKAVTPRICDALGLFVVGHVGSTGEAYVYDTTNGPQPISEYWPVGLKQKISPSFFKSYGIYSDGMDYSGIGHEKPQLNQAEYLNDVCIILPLTSYQILDESTGVVIGNEHPMGSAFVDCVAFATTTNAKSSYPQTGYPATAYPKTTYPTYTDKPATTYATYAGKPSATSYATYTDKPATTYSAYTEKPTMPYAKYTEKPTSSYVSYTDKPATTYASYSDKPSTTYATYTDKPATTYSAYTEKPTMPYAKYTEKPTSYVSYTDKPAMTYASYSDKPSTTYATYTDKPATTYSAYTEKPTTTYVSYTEKPTTTYVRYTEKPSTAYARTS